MIFHPTGSPVRETSLSPSTHRLVLLLLLLGWTLRVWVAWSGEFTLHSDEVVQYLEQGHRIVFGYGTVPWEFQLQARSLLLPLLVAAILYPFKLLGLDQPNLYTLGVELFLSGLAMAIPLGMYRWARSQYGERVGILALALGIGWYELAVFAHKALSELVATSLLFAGLAMLRDSRASAWLFSALLALAVAVRPHYGLAAAYLFILIWRESKPESRLSLGGGVATALALVVAIEVWTTGSPLGSYLNYFRENLIAGRAENFGVMPLYKYAQWALISSAGLFPLAALLGFASRDRKHHSHLLTILVLIYLPHLMTGHKEYRFVFLAIPFFLILVSVLIARTSKSWIRMVAIGTLLAISLTGFANRLPRQQDLYAVLTAHRVQSFYERRDDLEAYLLLSRMENVTGVIDLATYWAESGGYYYLHHPVPLYDSDMYRDGFADQPLELLASHILVRKGARLIGDYDLLTTIGAIQIWQRNRPEPAQIIWDDYNVRRFPS